MIHAILLPLALSAGCAAAQPTTEGLTTQQATIQIESYLARLAHDLSARALRDVTDLGAWKARRLEIRRQLLYMVGLDPLPERTPLHVKITRTIDKPDFTIECLVFESMPDFLVTANLYLPKKAKRPLPTIVYLCGHAGGPAGSKGHYRHHPIWYAQNGYACLIVDPIQHSEIPGRHRYTHAGKGWENFSTGYTPAGIEIWNAVRALDYLETRDEIDMARLGITGRSGGGTFSYFTAAVDDRIRAVVSDHATYTIGNHIAADTLRTHCDCNFFVNEYQIDSVSYCALIAPRPLLSQCSTDDGCFPPKGYRDFYAKMKKVYELYGQGDRIRIVDRPGPHKDFPEFQANAMDFFNRWLRGRQTDLTVDRDAVLKVIPTEAEVRVWLDKDQRPKRFINEEINHKLVPTYEERERPADRPAMVRRLREHVFANWPDEQCPLRAERLDHRSEDGVQHFRYLFESEAGLRILAEASLPPKIDRSPHSILWISEGPEDRLASQIDKLRTTFPVIRVYPRGTHGSEWNRHVNIFVRRAMTILGRSLDGARVYDAIRAIDMLQALRHACGERMTVVGTGKWGVLGIYAAMMDGRIRRVVVHEPTLTHTQDPILANVLRYTDVPLTASYLPPTELLVLGAEPSEFSGLRERFGACGMAERYRVIDSLGALTE